jgi:methionyl-tRNA formyltransferase
MTKPNIFLFGNRGYCTSVLNTLVDQKYTVVGLCTRPPKPPMANLRFRFGEFRRSLGLVRQDAQSLPGPMDQFELPANIATKAGIPVFSSRDIKSPEFSRTLGSLNPDVILVAGFHRLIPPSIYEQARIQAINFHPALLPKHRGGTPNRWVIRSGEKETGITAHLLETEFDTGDIVGVRKIEVSDMATWGDIELQTAAEMAPFVLEVLADIEAGTLSGTPQDDSLSSYEASYCHDDRIITWQETADDIRRICYAIRPKGGGFTRFGNSTLSVWDVELPTSASEVDEPPGSIIDIDPRGCPTVACKDGVVRITHFIQRGKVVPAAEISHRPKWKIGDRFESTL